MPIVSAADIYVPDNYVKIQWAVDNATTSDIIIVRDGTYTENVKVNKRLTIRSEKGSAHTIVSAAKSNDNVIKVTANYVNIAGFTIENATGSYKAGIYLGTGVDHCNVSDNYVSSNDCGIRLYKSSDNTITNNIASSNSKFGIYLYSSSNNILANNSANSNKLDGIRLRAHSNNNTLTNNIANSNIEAGILCWTSSDNILTYNNINLNAYGIWVYNSSCYNILANNNANSNDKQSIRLSSSSNNMIYINDFVNDGDNIYSYKSTNLFNSSSEIKYTYNGHIHTNYKGNYWSDYNGNDVDKDGIGDTPYSINSDNDEYPLMKTSEYYLPLPQYPDLMVEDIWIEPAEFYPGDEVKLYARIKNIGDADAVGKFWWNRYIGDTLINRYYRDGLAAGDSKRRCKKYTWPDDCMSHTIKVVVDADGNIRESNEGNNERSEKFSATPKPIFDLKSWKATVEEDPAAPRKTVKAVLRLKFDLLDDVNMQLLYEGYEIDRDRVNKEEKVVELRLRKDISSALNPKTGTYTLVVRSHGETVNTTEFIFRGSKLELVDIDLEWETVFSDSWKLKEHRVYLNAFTVKNSGDLPVYISKIADIYVDGGRWKKDWSDQDERYEWAFIPGEKHRARSKGIIEWVLPGEEKVVEFVRESERAIFEIPCDGQVHEITMVFMDYEDITLLPISIKSPK